MEKYYDKSKLEKLRKQKLNIYYGKKVTNKLKEKEFKEKELLKYYILGFLIVADIILTGILLATELYFK